MKFQGKLYAVGHATVPGGDTVAPMVTVRADFESGNVAHIQLPVTSEEAAELAHHLYGDLMVEIKFTAFAIEPADGQRADASVLAKTAMDLLSRIEAQGPSK
jgi:hypothetical protein